MAKMFSKLQVPTAVQETNKFPMSNRHITTNTFMRLGVGTFYQAVPGTKFGYTLNSFVRMNPLSHPVYGGATVKHKLFFVPFKSIFPAWNEFINRTVHNYDTNSSIPNLVPNISMGDIVKYIIGLSTLHPSGYTGAYDFDTFGNQKYSFTPFSKFVYNLLIQLGIRPDFTMDTANGDYRISAVKILCLARIYCDYFMNAQYLPSDVNYNAVMQLFANNTPTQAIITQLEFANIMTMIAYFYYPNDYFVSAFDNPVGPVNNAEGNNININDNTINIVSTNKSAIDIANNTPRVIQGDYQNVNVRSFSQYIDNALKKLTQYFQRHQFVGSRAAERHLAEWGLTYATGNEKSTYIDGLEYDIMFGDVMSNADTSSAILGSYAGKGIGAGEKRFDSKSFNEFGYFMELNYIIPKVGYVQGMTKDTYHMNMLDFFTPDFDNMGMDAVKGSELFVPNKNTFSDGTAVTWTNLSDQVFGFQPRYMEYKNKLDMLTGDFACDSLNYGMDGWHLMRQFSNDSFRINADNELHIVHDKDFTRNTDGDQYNRIFATSLTDNFIQDFRYQYEITAPMKSQYDMLNFEDLKNKITMALEGQRDS